MAEWIEKDGRWFDIDYTPDLEDYLRVCGLNPQTLGDTLIDLDNIGDDIWETIGQDYVTRKEGLVGDDFSIFLEGLESILRDLNDEVLEPLNGDMRKKGCHKQDIAKSLSIIVSNFDTLIH